MAQRPIHLVADNWFAQLNANVTSGATSWILKGAGADGLPTPSALQDIILHCGSEKALVTGIAIDTPSAGLDTLTVTRGYSGTTAAAHSENDYVGHFYYEDYHNDLARRIAMLEAWTWNRVGQANGVIRVSTTALQVTAAGTPSMTVHIAVGAAMVAGHPAALRAATTLVFIAPSGNPRIDCVQIDQSGNIEAVTGSEAASPSAPSVDADALKICEIYHRVGETSIKDADDSTNGYITDGRVYI